MNSDLMPSPESSNSTASDEAKSSQQANADAVATAEVSLKKTSSPEQLSETANDGSLVNRQQPIPPPSEPMQYRAIGLVRGRYIASSEQFTQGVMLTPDGTKLDAVLLGRIMSLVKNHLDLEQEHLWVVYPRTRQENDQLHLQIVGVWEPENLAKNSITEQQQDSTSPEEQLSDDESSQNLQEESLTISDPVPSSEIPDGGFSVRGEIVYQSYDTENLVIKIKQSPRKPNDKPKYFKLKLKGKLETKAVGKFWDLQVKRDGESLVIEKAEVIAELPRKRSARPPQRRGGGGGRRPGSGGSRKPYPPRRSGEAPLRPTKKVGDSSSSSPPSRPVPKGSVPKPVKRPKPPEE